MADIINIKDHNQDISDINTKIGDENSGLIKEVNDIKGTELQNLNASIQTLETLIGVDETVGDKTSLPSGDANIIASINRIDSKPSGTVTDEQISTAVNNYLTEHPVAGGATAEQAAQIEANRTNIATLKESVGDSSSGLVKVVTDGNTELTDLRIGQDNRTYSNAGDSVRSQFRYVNGVLTDFLGFNPQYNLTWIENESININNVVTTNTGSDRTDYITIQDNVKQLRINLNTDNKLNRIYLYDKYKRSVGYLELKINNNIIDVTEGVTYFRLSRTKETDIYVDCIIKDFKSMNKTLVNTEYLPMLKFNRGSTSGSNRSSAIYPAPDDLKKLLFINNVCSVNNEQENTNNNYFAYPISYLSDLLRIKHKYIFISFIVRTTVPFDVEALNSGRNIENTNWINNAYDISYTIEDYKALADSKIVTVKYKVKDEYINNALLYDQITLLFKEKLNQDIYNGFQLFYERIWQSDDDNIAFDYNLSPLLNKEFLTNNYTHGKYKKICIYGTSIEAGNYFDGVASRLGLVKGKNYFNYGSGGGRITWNGADQTLEHVKKGFSCTYEEKINKLREMGHDDTILSEADKVTSYDKSVLGNLDSDLFIFGTSGINDRTLDDYFTVDDSREYDRTTIYGAYNHVLKALFEAKPDANVLILGQHLFSWDRTKEVHEIQRTVSKKWGIPFADMGYNSGINKINKNTFTSDGCHLNTVGNKRLADFLFNYLT